MKGVKHLWRIRLQWAFAGAFASFLLTPGMFAATLTPQQPAQAQVAKQVGTIKNIDGNNITLTTDVGADCAVQVVGTSKMVRVAPGQTDLKAATPIQISDLHAGDRILVRGQPSADGKSFVAVGVIAMSRTDVEATHKSELEGWQKHGIGGLVSSVDPAAGTIVISMTTAAGKKTVSIHATQTTNLRRYAPGSISFDEAKSTPIDRIKPGDQLRARGTRSADGNDFTAEEVVSGTFLNIAGTISSADVNANTMNVMDLITKKTFVVKISGQTQLHRLPPEIAQRIAFRLKGAGAGTGAGGSAAGSTGGTGGAQDSGAHASAQTPAIGSGQRGNGSGVAGGGARPGGGGDFQQIVNRMPQATLADFKKDDAVMIVATEGGDSGDATAITILGGVEPILAAAPTASQAMTLSPWSLGGAPAAAAGDTP